MYIVVCTITGVLILGLWIPGSSNAASLVFAVFFGFSSGAYVSLSPALVAQISAPSEFGYRNGLLYFFASFPGLTTNPIAGAILSRDHGSFHGMKLFAGVCCLAGTAFVVAARLLNTGPKLLAKFWHALSYLCKAVLECKWVDERVCDFHLCQWLAPAHRHFDSYVKMLQGKYAGWEDSISCIYFIPAGAWV